MEGQLRKVKTVIEPNDLLWKVQACGSNEVLAEKN